MKTKEFYAAITEDIITALSKGTRPWQQPWNASSITSLPLRYNGKPYTGVNVLLLWWSRKAAGFTYNTWMTFKQAKSLGGSVTRGSIGTRITFASLIEKRDIDENGGECYTRRSVSRTYTVFNVNQIEGLPTQYYNVPAPLTVKKRIEHCEALVLKVSAEIRHGGQGAYYVPAKDSIQMPPFESFTCAEAYYGTLLHELVHWTGHKARLNRDFGFETRGAAAYAFEELIAEIGAAFLCAHLGIDPALKSNQHAYIASWIDAMQKSDRVIFRAASHAQKAVDYILSLVPS